MTQLSMQNDITMNLIKLSERFEPDILLLLLKSCLPFLFAGIPSCSNVPF